MNLGEIEYAELRATIRTRGTLRVAIAWAALTLWTVIMTAVGPFGRSPLAAIAGLIQLFAGFEAVAALHFGVERIGRYLQVFYESDEAPHPRWERTAMAFGPGMPGAGSDPLFSWLFAAAAALNVLTVQGLVPQLLLLAAHALFIVRIAMVRSTARRQRAEDLARYRELRDSEERPAAVRE